MELPLSAQEQGRDVGRIRQIILYRATAALRRPQIKQYTTSKEGIIFRNSHADVKYFDALVCYIKRVYQVCSCQVKTKRRRSDPVL